MLCDRGPNLRSQPYNAQPANTAPNRGLLITIQEQPEIVVPLSPAANFTLHSVPVPGAGVFNWLPVNPVVATVQSANMTSQDLTLFPVQAGTQAMTVDFQANGMNKQAAVTVHVVGLAFQPSGAELLLRKNDAVGIQIQAVPTKIDPNGTYAWSMAGDNAIQFDGGPNPGNVHTVTIKPLRPGLATVQVIYTCLGTQITHTTNVRVPKK
jgi:hypothetical protein